MPLNLTNSTVDEILYILEDANQQINWASAVSELRYRLCPNDYAVEELRGGIRPTHQPLNP